MLGLAAEEALDTAAAFAIPAGVLEMVTAESENRLRFREDEGNGEGGRVGVEEMPFEHACRVETRVTPERPEDVVFPCRIQSSGVQRHPHVGIFGGTSLAA